VGLWQGGFLLGGIAGPGVGGVVTQVSLRLPFFLYAGTLAVAGTVAILALRRTPLADRAGGPGAARTTLRAALRMPAYRAALATVFADSWASMGVRAALIPLFVKEALHRSVIWTGIGFWCVAGVNGLVLLALEQSLPAYLVAMGILGLGSGLLDVAPGAVVGDVVEGRGGPVFAAYSMSGDVANVVGPVATGALAEVAFGDAFALTAAILAGATAMGLVMPETRGVAQEPLDQGRAEVGEQVLGAFDADRKPDEVARDLEGGARSAGMGHAPGVLDQRLDATE
jgi:MFS family permease